MRVRIGTADALLEDAAVFTEFSAVLPEELAAGTPFSGDWGRYDGSHAWVDTDWLREQKPAGAEGSGWLDQLTGMLQYAAAKGWMNDDGTQVRAHVDFA